MEHPGKILKAHELRASKKRGQNFLCQPGTAQAIAGSSGAGPDDLVVEIGPGLGALTFALARLARKVTALEVDRGLHRVLSLELAQAGVENVDLRLCDALDFAWQEEAAAAGGRFIVVGNLPYSISSPLLFALLENRDAWRTATLMLQKELAARIVAGPGGKDYGVISVLLQTFLAVKRGMAVGPEQFFPRPQVESRIISLAPLEEPLLHGASAAWHKKVVKAAFGQRRKTLANSLASGLGLSRSTVQRALDRAGVDPKRRAETLSLLEMAAAARELAEAGGNAE